MCLFVYLAKCNMPTCLEIAEATDYSDSLINRTAASERGLSTQSNLDGCLRAMVGPVQAQDLDEIDVPQKTVTGRVNIQWYRLAILS